MSYTLKKGDRVRLLPGVILYPGKIGTVLKDWSHSFTAVRIAIDGVMAKTDDGWRVNRWLIRPLDAVERLAELNVSMDGRSS